MTTQQELEFLTKDAEDLELDIDQHMDVCMMCNENPDPCLQARQMMADYEYTVRQIQDLQRVASFI